MTTAHRLYHLHPQSHIPSFTHPFQQHPHSSSSNHGIESWAPLLSTVFAAARFALRTASSISKFPPTTSSAYAPTNVSPAAVVSTTVAFSAGTNPFFPPFAI